MIVLTLQHGYVVEFLSVVLRRLECREVNLTTADSSGFDSMLRLARRFRVDLKAEAQFAFSPKPRSVLFYFRQGKLPYEHGSWQL